MAAVAAGDGSKRSAGRCGRQRPGGPARGRGVMAARGRRAVAGAAVPGGSPAQSRPVCAGRNAACTGRGRLPRPRRGWRACARRSRGYTPAPPCADPAAERPVSPTWTARARRHSLPLGRWGAGVLPAAVQLSTRRAFCPPPKSTPARARPAGLFFAPLTDRAPRVRPCPTRRLP